MISQTDTAVKQGRSLLRPGLRVMPNPAFVLLVVACAIFGVLEPKFLSAYNIANIAGDAEYLLGPHRDDLRRPRGRGR